MKDTPCRGTILALGELEGIDFSGRMGVAIQLRSADDVRSLAVALAQEGGVCVFPSGDVLPSTSKGARLIVAERQRQISEEGWSAAHDSLHDDGELAAAAICYAAPQRVFVREDRSNMTIYSDPWPWAVRFDRRYRCGSGRSALINQLPAPATYTAEERLDLLVKAGALIAAEIDLLLRRRTLESAGDEGDV